MWRKVERRIVGFVLLRSKTDTGRTGEIELIGVEPGFHGRGIGKALVAQAIRHYQGKSSRDPRRYASQELTGGWTLYPHGILSCSL